MKRLIAFIVLFYITNACYSQTQYTVTTIAYRRAISDNNSSSEPFKSVTQKTYIYLYRNAIVVEGEAETWVKFARRIDGNEITQWNGTDKYDNICEVYIKDFGTYSEFIIRWLKSGRLICYKTL